jgi:hypothetical protein
MSECCNSECVFYASKQLHDDIYFLTSHPYSIFGFDVCDTTILKFDIKRIIGDQIFKFENMCY